MRRFTAASLAAADSRSIEPARRAVGTLTAKALRAAPAAVAHSAAWLDRGTATLDLQFDSAALLPSGLDAPYELRDLRLINQADMSLIERRERAASLR
jgi:hypothetical protein